MIDLIRINIKRIYDAPADSDGVRVLVDRLWPRGIKKEDARIDLWMKDLAPTNTLRKCFNHEPSGFNEFRIRYLQELDMNRNIASTFIKQNKNRIITLLYAARDTNCNHAIVLREFLTKLYSWY